jgi:hypothetical protein
LKTRETQRKKTEIKFPNQASNKGGKSKQKYLECHDRVAEDSRRRKYSSDGGLVVGGVFARGGTGSARKAFVLLMGLHFSNSTRSPTLNLLSGSWAWYFFLFLTRFLYLGWIANLTTSTFTVLSFVEHTTFPCNFFIALTARCEGLLLQPILAVVEFGVKKRVDPLRKEQCPVPMLLVGTGIFKLKPIVMAIAILSPGHGFQHRPSMLPIDQVEYMKGYEVQAIAFYYPYPNTFKGTTLLLRRPNHCIITAHHLKSYLLSQERAKTSWG